MRKATVVALALSPLALSPLMVHAQADRLSSMRASTKLSSAMMMAAASPEDRPTTKVGGMRISTGVIAPVLVHSVEVREETVSAVTAGHERTVVVAMVVDEKGVPSDVKLVEATGTSLDHNVIDAVKQFRYKPGTVSGLPVAVPVNLQVIVKEPSL